MTASKTRIYPIPDRFVPGVPAAEQEFDSKADAERFLESATGGIQHSSAFALTKSDAKEAAANPPAATEADDSNVAEGPEE